MTVSKPTTPEEEYFIRIEAEKLKKLAEQKRKAFSEREREELKNLHWMHCPKCGMEMQSVPYRDITLD